MKTVEIEVYHFDELPSEAQDRAISDFLVSDREYPWAHENRESLEAFCKAFGVKLSDWQYSAWSHSWYKLEYLDGMQCGWESGEHDVTGLRLRTWLINNFDHILWERKPIGSYPYKRRSRIMEQETCCPWTGYCMDDTLLRPMREFIRKPEPGMEWETLVRACLDAWLEACVSECEYFASEEYAREQLEDLYPDMLYTIDGKEWHWLEETP